MLKLLSYCCDCSYIIEKLSENGIRLELMIALYVQTTHNSMLGISYKPVEKSMNKNKTGTARLAVDKHGKKCIVRT